MNTANSLTRNTDTRGDTPIHPIQLTDAEEKLILRLRQLKLGMAILCFGNGEFRFVPLPKLEQMTGTDAQS